MEPNQRIIQFLKLLRRTKILNRKIVQDELFPADKDGSVTRDFLRKGLSSGLARRIGTTSELHVQVAPCYIPTESGCALLATQLNDMRWLLDAEPRIHPQDIPHALCVSRLIIDLDKAMAGQSYVELPQLYREQDVGNAQETDPAKRFKLYTVVAESPKRIVCVPDMATLIRVGPYGRAYYWEYETGADGSPSRVAARKSQGYYGLHQSQLFKRHFPDAQDMRVIAVCPGSGFRESLRRAVREQKGAERWLFVDRNDVSVKTLLHGPVFYTCQDEPPRPLVKTPGPVPVAAPAEG